jgi:hippurate hydrolase
VLSAQIIMALQTIVSREIKPVDPAVVTVGSIHGGSKHNIISDRVDLQLTLRSYSDEVRRHTLSAIKRIIENLARAAGVPEDRVPTMKVQDVYTPATYNDPDLTERLAGAFKAALGESNVQEVEPVMGGEDFGQYGRQEPKIPISIFWLGSVAPSKFEMYQKEGKSLPSLHSSQFAPEMEPSIKTGVKAITSAAMAILGKSN